MEPQGSAHQPCLGHLDMTITDKQELRLYIGDLKVHVSGLKGKYSKYANPFHQRNVFTRHMALGKLCVKLHEPSRGVLPLPDLRAKQRFYN